MFNYYVKIVPTIFARLDGSTFVTNQFSVTRHSKVVSAFFGDGSGMPGVFFSYELAPMMVKYSEKQKSLGKSFWFQYSKFGSIPEVFIKYFQTC